MAAKSALSFRSDRIQVGIDVRGTTTCTDLRSCLGLLRRNDFMDRRLEDGRWAYEIEVRNGANVFDVEVDADKGTVIATAEGRPGADDDKPD